MKIKQSKIKSINICDNQDVYDIEVRNNHNFFANNILVHNCGEQILPIGGVCLLGSINLTQFIDFENSNWDYNKLDEIIPIAVRMLDNVNDKTYVPLESQREGIKNKRRIGLGIFGYGSALMMLKIRYGSDKALELTEKLMNFIANKAYLCSSLIAKEKGAFLLYDEDKYLSSEYLKVLEKDTIDSIKKYGIRNSHLLSIQPTGNCVKSNTIIKTNKGNISMKNIFDMNNINITKSDKNRWYIPIVNIEVETLNKNQRITGLYVNNKKDVYSVKTENDNLIEGTDEHKLLVKINDKEAVWKELKDIKIGDKILLKK